MKKTEAKSRGNSIFRLALQPVPRSWIAFLLYARRKGIFVPESLSVRMYWVPHRPTPPTPHASVAPPLRTKWGVDTIAWGEGRVCGDPIPTKGQKLRYSMYDMYIV